MAEKAFARNLTSRGDHRVRGAQRLDGKPIKSDRTEKLLVETKRREDSAPSTCRADGRCARTTTQPVRRPPGERGAIGGIETRNLWLQSRGQLATVPLRLDPGLLVFCRTLWDEVDLLKKFQPTETEP